MAGIAEVAARAGVSPAVVSRVLNRDAGLRISAQTRVRVLDAIAELKYVPQHAARTLRMGLPSALTLVIPDTTNSVHAELVRGVESAARDRDLAVMLASSEHVTHEREWLGRIVQQGRTDGVIFQPPPELGSDAVRAVTDVAAPVVLINWDETSSDRTIVFDDADGVRVAVEHLIGLGHRSIGFAGAIPGHSPGLRRRQGFESTMREHGLAVVPEWMTEEGFTSEQGRVAARRLLEADTLPTAVVVANTNAAMGFLAELHAHGIDVPGELSIVAIHDVWLADATWPPLTTVRMPFHEMGVAAVGMLFDDLPESDRHVVLHHPLPQIVARQSTRRID